MSNNRILVTGAAGFIGSHFANKILSNKKSVLCIDNFNPYYDVSLKKYRKSKLEKYASVLNSDKFFFEEIDLRDKESTLRLVANFRPDSICHFAAQAGVRYSLENPNSYIDNNVLATTNLLEASRLYGVKDIIFASTSSVYGLNTDMPFTEESPIDTTISTYSTTKRACELLCHTYHHLYDIRFRILRFFTVYGPWGRPDMALFKFTKSILDNEPIMVYNNGRMQRDFTYVDDIVDGFVLALEKQLDFEIINLGCGDPIDLMDFIKIIEYNLNIKSIKQNLPMQPGDVKSTWADISKAKHLLGYVPKIKIDEGIPLFIEWYKKYYDL